MTTTTTDTATYRSLVGNALQLLGVGLGPYISVRLRDAAGRGYYVPTMLIPLATWKATWR